MTATDVLDLLRQARNQAHLTANHGDPTALLDVIDQLETAIRREALDELTRLTGEEADRG